MRAVLVTGAAAPLGQRLVRSLLADTRVSHVLAVDDVPAEQALPFSHAGRLTYLTIDLRKTRKVRELLFGPARDLDVEVVVHLSEHMDGFGRGRAVHAQNVESLRSILELSDRHPSVRRLVVKSHAVVYRVGLDLPVQVTEDHPLNMSPHAPQYVRDRVEADLTACARMGLVDSEIVVLRCAEALAPGIGSQLYDYLDGPAVFRPMGFDPMVNVASPEDIVHALELATHGSGEGVFNIPGFDTLPLSEAARKWGRPQVPLPAPLIRAVYRARHALMGSEYSFGIHANQLHFGLVLDGTRARHVLGYRPRHPIDWPVGGPISDPIVAAAG
ncbi:MAG: NAD-dependent epimerase/dehydratase family protein [Alphaproteobacteria bacterium]|nr:NAD-dependent epimerase/dehydratase family protein [Alphaproteobacteria bacterium]